jgi:hypothetical protein
MSNPPLNSVELYFRITLRRPSDGGTLVLHSYIGRASNKDDAELAWDDLRHGVVSSETVSHKGEALFVIKFNHSWAAHLLAEHVLSETGELVIPLENHGLSKAWNWLLTPSKSIVVESITPIILPHIDDEALRVKRSTPPRSDNSTPPRNSLNSQ